MRYINRSLIALKKYIFGDDMTVEECVRFWEIHCWKDHPHKFLWEHRWAEIKEKDFYAS